MSKAKYGFHRFTMDIPLSTHRKLKAICALTGRQMYQIIDESILDKLKSDKDLNELLTRLCVIEKECL